MQKYFLSIIVQLHMI